MSTSPRVVIIGAGVVGTNLADELTARGVDQVTVVDQGPLPLTGGSTSHAPGLVFQVSPSKTMTQFATTPSTSSPTSISTARGASKVGGLEVATTPSGGRPAPPARLADLWESITLVDAGECVRLHSLLDRDRVLAVCTPRPTAWPSRTCGGRPGAARRGAGARFQGSTRVVASSSAGGRVTGVRTSRG